MIKLEITHILEERLKLMSKTFSYLNFEKNIK